MPNTSAPTFLPPGVNPDGPYPLASQPPLLIVGSTPEAKTNRATLAQKGEYPPEMLSDSDSDLVRQLEAGTYNFRSRLRQIPPAENEKGFLRRAPYEPAVQPKARFSFFL